MTIPGIASGEDRRSWKGGGCIAQPITRFLIKGNQDTSNLQTSSDEFMEEVYSTFENGDKILKYEGPPRFVIEVSTQQEVEELKDNAIFLHRQLNPELIKDRIFEDLPERKRHWKKQEKEDAWENEGNCEFINFNEILKFPEHNFSGAWTIRYET